MVHRIKHPDGERDYLVITGTVREGSRQIVVAVVTTKVPTSIQVSFEFTSSIRILEIIYLFLKIKARDSLTLDVLTITTYGTLRDSSQYSSMKDNLEKDALKVSVINFIIFNLF